MTARRSILALLAAVAVLVTAPAPGAAAPAGEPVTVSLDPAAWEAVPADGVALHLAADAGPDGRPALRLDYDFQGRGGWAAARVPLDLTLPESYELRFALLGRTDTDTAPNHLEVKLVGPTGENVWWHVERDLPWPGGWTAMRVRKRQISYAWGPLGAAAGAGGPPRLGALEIAVTAGGGGRGSLWIADLAVVPTEPARPPEGPPVARADSAAPGHPPDAALDGDRATAWRPAADGGTEARFTIDLRGRIELGGLSVYWQHGHGPDRFLVEASEDGESWQLVRAVAPHGAAESHLRMPDAEARLLRLRFPPGACSEPCGLAEAVVRRLAFGASRNAFFAALAAEAPRGTYPRGFSGQAVYWTVVGADGADDEALLSEDGALEAGERGFSLEPFIRLNRDDGGSDGGGGRELWSWAEASSTGSVTQSLADDELPLPTVTWTLPGEPASGAPPVRLDVQPLVTGDAGDLLLTRYRVTNRGTAQARGSLLVAVRPFQVNPPVQFLNVAGGVATLDAATCLGDGLRLTRGVGVAGKQEVVLRTSPPPRTCVARTFDEAPSAGAPRDSALDPAFDSASDLTGAASALLAWPFDLAPGEVAETVVAVPLPPRAEPGPAPAAATFTTLLDAARQRWRRHLGPLELDLPPSAAPLVHTLRSSLAWILIHRDGPAIQPGSRAYARSWIRDGALTGSALLRLGHAGVARDFADWFAGFQYPDGKVPCCVDRRGADPVPEHDSHGELIHLVAEIYRFTGDRAFAERLFPHVEAAVGHIETLRQQRRTAAYRQADAGAFFGLLPESISHEGYSAKPVHSYWDDVWAVRGLGDAALLAADLGHPGLAATWAARRDEMRRDLLASMDRVRRRDGLPYLPASADLGDFDSTSTTVALDPGGLGPFLPADALEATFETFWQRFVARRDGDGAARGDGAYTPYEIRHVGAFVRLGWKARAHELLAYYLADRRPVAWNGWPEVVTLDPRERRFLGDLPHGWVASDFVRSLLDLFAYEEPSTGTLVLGAGVPAAWLDRPAGIAVRHLATPWGELSYRLQRHGDGVRYTLEPPTGPRPHGDVPPGGLVFTWPLAGRPGAARVDGRAVPLGAGGRLVVTRRPTTVELSQSAAPHDAPREER